jgi:DNA polymerase-3 subunit delta
MRIGPDQLGGRLPQGLAPIYLLWGDEPLQLGEAADRIRAEARRQGFTERQVIDQGRDVDWSLLRSEARALSLFAERRLIELRLSSDGVGRDGGDALRDYCASPPDDVLLLILAPALTAKTLKGKWAQAIDQAGVLVQSRRLQGRQLDGWLAQRLRRAGFEPDPDAIGLLAARVEGNLLAADQEIAKLRLLREPGPLDAAALLGAVADSARFDLFDLGDAAMSADLERVDRVLRGLAAEGTAEPLVLWVLAREVRKLAAIAFAQAKDQNLAPVLAAHQVFSSRRNAVLATVKRFRLPQLWRLLILCAEADDAIKGQSGADPWVLLRRIAEGLADPRRLRAVAPV